MSIVTEKSKTSSTKTENCAIPVQQTKTEIFELLSLYRLIFIIIYDLVTFCTDDLLMTTLINGLEPTSADVHSQFLSLWSRCLEQSRRYSLTLILLSRNHSKYIF